MTKAEDAVALFQQGFNCTQSILSVFAPDFGLDQDMARRISQGFGAGMGLTDNICGSLSGAIMVIGLRYGSIRADDTAAKEKTYAVVAEFSGNLKRSMARLPAPTCSGTTCQTRNKLLRRKRIKSRRSVVRHLSAMP